MKFEEPPHNSYIIDINLWEARLEEQKIAKNMQNYKYPIDIKSK